jgi:ribonuclease I
LRYLFLVMLFISSIFANMIFSASYQKDFCKVNYQKECKFSKNWDYFTIHGLWPKKENCAGVKHFRLSKDLWNELKIYMPSNYLKKHEWAKHGRCYSHNPEVYFRDMVILIKQINNSPCRTCCGGSETCPPPWGIPSSQTHGRPQWAGKRSPESYCRAPHGGQ